MNIEKKRKRKEVRGCGKWTEEKEREGMMITYEMPETAFRHAKGREGRKERRREKMRKFFVNWPKLIFEIILNKKTGNVLFRFFNLFFPFASLIKMVNLCITIRGTKNRFQISGIKYETNIWRLPIYRLKIIFWGVFYHPQKSKKIKIWFFFFILCNKLKNFSLSENEKV